VPSLRGLPKWTQQDIVDYLQTGRNSSASVAGEMTSVVANSTSHMSDGDVNAMAAYLKSLAAPGGTPPRKDSAASSATTAKLTAATGLTLGERLYVDNCAACHFVNGKGAPRTFPRQAGRCANAFDGEGAFRTADAVLREPAERSGSRATRDVRA
jgi:mono/diheme cytochrome c family protein